MNSVPLNYWAILVSALVAMVMGMLWYSPALFFKAWMKATGTTEADMAAAKNKGMSKQMSIGALLALVMSYVLANIVGFSGAATFGDGMQTGFWVWLGFVATATANAVLYERKTWAWYRITIGYYLVSLVLMGGILAAWQ
jgi:hypothetical protein